MKSKYNRVKESSTLRQRGAAILSIVALLASTFAAGISAQSMSGGMKAPGSKSAARLSEDQRILHVLNRLGFGARPGDVERVKAMGIDNYITQQLFPEKIDDSASEAKLQNLETLRMSTAELYEKYPQPGQLLKQLQKRGDLPADLAAARDNRVKGGANAAPNANAAKTGEAMTGEMQGPEAAKANDPAKSNAQANNVAANPMDSPEYRKAVLDYFMENNLRPAQFLTGELQMSRILRATYSERQLQEVMVDFWTNHFNVFAGKGADRWLLTSYDRDTIRPHTLGKFYDLLLADAQSPAMLFYLDNFQSVSPDAQLGPQQRPGAARGALAQLMRMTNNPQQQQQQQRRGINENYARELMELHTLGVDGGYTQKDVQEVARCFSGWTIQKPNEEGLFLYRPGLHDNGEKIVLGHKIPAGGGIADGERVLDILATHPATAHFIATKLARRFISDDPPSSVIDRAAEVFLKTDGSIRETLRAIITAPEFFSAATYRAKIRSPFEYVAAAMRALNADTDGDRPVLDAIGRMGQPVFGRITPDGYADRADQWLSSGSMVARFNFANALPTNRMKGTSLDVSQLLPNVDQANKDSVATQLIRLTVFGDVSAGTRTALEKTARSGSAISQVAPPSAANVSVAFSGSGTPPQTASPPVTPYISELITLLIGSPEFQQR